MPADQRICESPDAVAQVIRDAAAAGTPVIDYGDAHRGLGHPPPDRHIALRQTGGVIEHQARDFTVIAAGGCAVGELRRVLADAGQFVPLDADDDLTLAEVVTHNVYGPLRVSLGGPRDLLLGLQFVDGRGGVNRVGGRTVKNVAGYDVTRLMVGSLNELGIVTEVTLRTCAQPPSVLSVDLVLDGQAGASALDRLMPAWRTADAAPAWLCITSDHDPAGTPRLVARLAYFGSPLACDHQLRSLETLIDAEPAVRLHDATESTWAADVTRRAGLRGWLRAADAVVKAVVPPAATATLIDAGREQPGEPLHNVLALPVHGVVYAGGNLDAETAEALDHRVTAAAKRADGYRVWLHHPAADPPPTPIDPLPPHHAAQSAIKRALDPDGVLNPGRYLVVKPTATPEQSQPQ